MKWITPSTRAALVLASLLAVVSMAGCRGGGVAAAETETIHLALDGFTDATVDVGLNVVHAATLATLHAEAGSGLSTPFSTSCTFDDVPVTISVSVKFHLLPGAALTSGSIVPSGTALADGGAKFTRYSLPLFVVDNPSNPSELARVQSIDSDTDLTLQTPFTGATYYLFQVRQISGTISSGSRAPILPFFFCDDTLGTSWFTTVY